jgi:hypothetical protein
MMGKLRKEAGMYSPKIKDELIPMLYGLAKREGKPMTDLVDEILRAELKKRISDGNDQTDHDNSGPLKKPLDEW